MREVWLLAIRGAVTLKACVNCKWVNGEELALCDSPQRPSDRNELHRVLVYGEDPPPISIFCHRARMDEKFCGLEAKWFEQKRPTILKRIEKWLLSAIS